MIDIHCHIVPVDDGAKNIQEAIEMARLAEEDGITKIINTSHYNPEFEYIKGKQLIDEIERFNKILKQENVNIEVLAGNEIYYNQSILNNLDNNLDFFTLANSKYVLIEFSPAEFPKNILDIVYEFRIRGYKVILAHIERYQEIQKDKQNLIAQISNEEGVYIQVNASSVLKKGPSGASEVCEKLIKNNQVHLIATDAHGYLTRKPQLKQAYEYIKQNYGHQNAQILFEKNPQNILENKELIKTNIITKQKSKLSIFSKILKKW